MSSVKEVDQQVEKQKDEGSALTPSGFGANFGASGPKAPSSSLRDAVSVPVAGGVVSPARVGQGYGVRWTKKFSEGGKTKSASSRADGIAQRGKTRGKYL